MKFINWERKGKLTDRGTCKQWFYLTNINSDK